MKFYLFSITVMFILGFVGGVAATKRAITGPDWVQRIFGIQLPPPQPAAAPQQPAPPIAQTPAPQVTPPAQTPVQPPNPPAAPTTSGKGTASKTAGNASTTTSDPNGFLGSWEITDEVQAGDGTPTQIRSGYVFNSDGSGEFNTNGKKMYSLHWTIADDYLTVTYDNEQAPAGEDGAIRMRWSVTPDKTLLTLVPENAKDARESLYSVGHGVYHKK